MSTILGAIQASETKDWGANLSDHDAKQASRYLFSELNGFPKWFRSFNECFPDIVTKTIVTEIKWDLFHNPAEESSHYVLSDIGWHAAWLNNQIAPSILDLLAKGDPKIPSNLVSSISILLNASGISDIDISSLAKSRFEIGNIKFGLIWLATWTSTDPESAIPALKKHLKTLGKKDATDAAIEFLNLLYGGRQERGLASRDNHKQSRYLKELYLLMLEYIRLEDDIERAGKGVYSPNSRDEAQDARNRIFSELLEIPGKEAFDALMEIAKAHRSQTSNVWMRMHALKRAELDADGLPWSVSEYLEFGRDMERTPKTNQQLFNLVVYRLQDLKAKLEDGDASIASIVIRAEEETELRNYIGSWLRDNANGKYAAPQEEEMADAKRPNIRIHGSSVDAPVPIELKIADKNWSGAELFERLETQLCGDYMRDCRSGSGIFLLVYRGMKNYWVHPHTKKTFEV